MNDPAYALEDSLGGWRAQPIWPMNATSYEARLSSGQYVDNGGASTSSAPAAVTADRRDGWDMETAPRIEPLSRAEKNAAKDGDAAASSFGTWSTPAPRQMDTLLA